MKAEYDFSKGERGKFYRKDATFNLPVYLDPKAMKFVTTIARKRRTDVSVVVNELIHRDMRQANAAK